MIRNINQENGILSSFTNYRFNAKKKTVTNSIIDFEVKTEANYNTKANNAILFALNTTTKEEVKKEQKTSLEPDSSTRIDNEDGSYTETIRRNGTEKKVTCYKDGSYDEIYKSKNGVSYMKIKRYTSKDDYTEVYQDSTGFCGKETFTKLDDGTSISSNEFSNGKKYTETYRKNPDGGFTRILKNSDGTGYTETQAYKEDGTSTYSIENEDGSGNTVIYNADGSYVEILTDSNGQITVNKFEG